jgi:hypothetical protein
VVGLAVTIVLFSVFRRRSAMIPEGVEEKPPWDVAIAALEALERREITSPEDVNRFYTELSYILRRYYEGRFLFPAVEHTTSEILKELRGMDEVKPYLPHTANFLMKSDMVKFAKYVPELVNSEVEIGAIREIIESTMEREEEGVVIG